MIAQLTKKIISDLENILLVDQKAIENFRSGSIESTELSVINGKHTSFVKEIINKYGFPTINLSSINAYKAAILVILHSEDYELVNQTIYLLERENPKNIQKPDIAFMIDKLRVLQNKPQLYGTQYKIKENNTIEFIEIEDIANLDKRRAEFDMENDVEYKKRAIALLK